MSRTPTPSPQLLPNSVESFLTGLIQAIQPVQVPRPRFVLEPCHKDKKLWEVRKGEDGAFEIVVRLHPGQLEGWNATEQIIGIIAGTQSGKTSYGPLWLLREIFDRGDGDYIVVSPTNPLLRLKALPEFKRLFEAALGLGVYKKADKIFVFHQHICDQWFNGQPVTVFFGYAANSDSLESATAKAVWADECGQAAFPVDSFEALQRRVSLMRGRMLLTTTPYNLGWLKTQVWDRFKAGDMGFRCVNFDSTANPTYPTESFDEARKRLPSWKFDLMYRGIFVRPAGVIYEAYGEKILCRAFRVPPNWRRVIGMDFGPVNTAAVFFAQSPKTKVWYLYRTYKGGGKTAQDHLAAILHREPTANQCEIYFTGGAPSEDEWRDKYAEAGAIVEKPAVSSVEAGIDSLQSLMRARRLRIFKTLDKLDSEFNTYAYELDDKGEPIIRRGKYVIESKAKYHRLDGARYGAILIESFIESGPGDGEVYDTMEVDQHAA